MHLEEVGPGRYCVRRNKSDERYLGTIERQDFIRIVDDERAPASFWLARRVTAQFHEESRVRFDSRDDAAAYVLKPGKAIHPWKS